jgi:hypothetical protein
MTEYKRSALIRGDGVETRDLGSTAREGHFVAAVASIGNIDVYADKILPGAFQKSLAALEAAGRRVPVLWNHASYEPPIGYAARLYEVPGALVMEAVLDLENPRARATRSRPPAWAGSRLGSAP